jgi:Integrase core domain
MQNAFAESFLGRFRDECLNDTLFSSLAAARHAINQWKEDYNHHRPHSAIGNIPSAKYAMKSMLEKQAALGQKWSQGRCVKLDYRRFSCHGHYDCVLSTNSCTSTFVRSVIET